MKMEYEQIDGYTVTAPRLSFTDLKFLLQEFTGLKVRIGDYFYTVTHAPVYRVLYGRTIDSYELNGVYKTEKFSDIARIMNIANTAPVTIEFNFPVALVGDDLHCENETCITWDTDTRLLKDDCYYCETDCEWYEKNDDLIEIDGNWYRDDDDDIFWCEHCHEYCIGEAHEVHVSESGEDTETWCHSCARNDAFQCDDCREWYSNDYHYHSDYPDRDICPSCEQDNYHYCERCGSTVHNDYYNWDEEMCDDCASSRSEVKSYHWHHSNSFKNKNMLFMANGKMIRLGSRDIKDTCGIELEVTADDRSCESETIEKLNELQVDENEFFYEHDCSIGEGFEIITGVHTFRSIKEMKWEEMLEVLKDNGYCSHDGGKCGLHIHIGRKYFGKYETDQDFAIGRIYAFYALFWDDMVKASRRSNTSQGLHYCNKAWIIERSEFFKDNRYVRNLIYKKGAARDGCHTVALNNTNSHTFEFRLGRGTLRYESLMAWIDLTLTIARNSKRMPLKHLTDCNAWLKGISKETAEYLKSRHAFEDSLLIKNLTENTQEA